MANWQLLNQTLIALFEGNIGDTEDENYDASMTMTMHLMTVTPSCQPNADPTSPVQQVPFTLYLCATECVLLLISKRDCLQYIICHTPLGSYVYPCKYLWSSFHKLSSTSRSLLSCVSEWTYVHLLNTCYALCSLDVIRCMLVAERNMKSSKILSAPSMPV